MTEAQEKRAVELLRTSLDWIGWHSEEDEKQAEAVSAEVEELLVDLGEISPRGKHPWSVTAPPADNDPWHCLCELMSAREEFGRLSYEVEVCQRLLRRSGRTALEGAVLLSRLGVAVRGQHRAQERVMEAEGAYTAALAQTVEGEPRCSVK